MIHVTENAASQIQKLLEKQELGNGGLRVGVKAGGCSGFEYVFEWEAEPRADDVIFDMSLLSRGFMFQNPKAKSTCGCGTSFSM